MDGFKELVDNLKRKLTALSFNQKVILGAVATACVISVAVFSLWLQKEEQAVLFTNMSPEDASAALTELAKQDINSKLVNGGTTIMVPETEVYRLRVELAAKGLPSSGTVGFEIFDGKQYGLTEFLQNVNFKRALEGELTRTIEGLHGIQSARVHLVLPKPSIFQKLTSKATASVVLRMGRGTNLAANQIKGIQSVVASSVENLEAGDVQVINQNGVVLSSTVKNDELGRSENQLALRKEVEEHLAEKASSMLDTALGAGRSIVRVDATLNFEKIDREREIYDPANTVVRSETRQESNDGTTGGTDENSVTNYEINRTVEHIVGHTGGIKSLSVAVFVDGDYVPGADGADPVYQPLSEEDLGRFKRIVSTAVGLNTIRGDQIEVVNMQFRNSTPNGYNGGGGGMAPDWLGLLVQYGGKALLLIMVAVLALSLRKNLASTLSEVFHPTGTVIGTREESDHMPEHFDGIPEMNDKVVDEIQEYASENPERVAEVIQSWIRDIDLSPQANAAAGD